MPKTTKLPMFSFVAEQSLLDALKQYATARGISASAVARLLIAERVTGETQDVHEALDQLRKRIERLEHTTTLTR